MIERMSGLMRVRWSFILSLAALGILALTFWKTQTLTTSSVNPESFDFSSLERTGKPNDYLVCPEGFCAADSDDTSPVFEVPAARLQEEWTRVVLNEPRTTKVSSEVGSQITYEQRSPLFRFPDFITAEFYPMGENQSTLAVYSRSYYGYWDLGVNRRRVQNWLHELGKRLGDLK